MQQKFYIGWKALFSKGRTITVLVLKNWSKDKLTRNLKRGAEWGGGGRSCSHRNQLGVVVTYLALEQHRHIGIWCGCPWWRMEVCGVRLEEEPSLGCRPLVLVSGTLHLEKNSLKQVIVFSLNLKKIHIFSQEWDLEATVERKKLTKQQSNNNN